MHFSHHYSLIGGIYLHQSEKPMHLPHPYRLIVCEVFALVSRGKREISLDFFDCDFQLFQRVDQIVHNFLLLGCKHLKQQ